MFKQAIRGVTTLPKYLSSDHDPLYRFHQWEANLRVLTIEQMKTIPHVPLSHPFIERLIGSFVVHNKTSVGLTRFAGEPDATFDSILQDPILKGSPNPPPIFLS